jgi:hypothetical protein
VNPQLAFEVIVILVDLANLLGVLNRGLSLDPPPALLVGP